MKHRFVLLLAYSLFQILFSCPAASGQNVFLRKLELPQEYRSASKVNCIIQDRRGFIWLGSNAGLFRYDGKTYELIFKDSEVISIYVSRDNTLFCGTSNGKLLYVRNNSTEEIILKNNTFPVNSITESPTGAIWASTYGNGVFRVKDSTVTPFNESRGLTNNHCYSLCSVANKIFIGSDNGITVIISDSLLSNLEQNPHLQDQIITSLSVKGDSILFIGSESGYLNKLDLRTGRLTLLPALQEPARVLSTLPMGDDLWAGTDKGLLEWRNNSWSKIGNQDGEQIRNIISLSRDREGNIWIAQGRSTFFMTNNSFTSYSLGHVKDVSAVYQEYNGTVWFADHTGVSAMGNNVPDKSSILTINSSLKGSKVLVIQQQDKGTLWFASFGSGVVSFDSFSQTTRHYTEKDKLINNSVLSLALDSDTMYVATLAGIQKLLLRNGKLINIQSLLTKHPELSRVFVYKIFIDSKRRIWFGTDGNGIFLLEGLRLRHFTKLGDSEIRTVYSIAEDANGKIWFNTLNEGLFSFDGTSFKNFSLHNGLRDLNISGIVPTANGNILVISNAGVDVLNTRRGNFFYHGEELGLNEINPQLNASTAAYDGTIWIGGSDRLIEYRPASEVSNVRPQTIIKSMQLFLRARDLDSTIFTHDENHISFEYAGLWFHDPSEIQFNVKLEGYDREWTRSRNTFITYPKLPPGRYTFMVSSSATGDFSGADMAYISFEIKAPFYTTIYFKILLAFVAVILLLIMFRLRDDRLRKKEMRKQEEIMYRFETLKSQVNPHFLFNSFNTLIDVIETDKDKAVEYVEKMSDFYRNILHIREKKLVSVEEEINMLGDYYFLQKKRFGKNLILNISIEKGYLNDQVVPLSLQLLVENAIKHNIVSANDPLTIDITSENEQLLISNRIQLKPSPEPSTGVGLQNIINRYALLTHKKVEIQNDGKLFRVIIPILKEE